MLRSLLRPTSMSRSPLSPTSTRSLLPSLPPSLPTTTLPLLHMPDTPSLPLLTTLPPSPMPAMPSLPLPTLELTPLAFPTRVNSSLFHPFSRPETPFPPLSVPQRMQQHLTACERISIGSKPDNL